VLRLAVVLGLALPLAAADLAWKQTASTPSWAYHGRSVGWLLLSIVLVAITLALARVPSRSVMIGSGVLAGGVLGNALSGAWNDLQVPNPIVVEGDRATLAFNLADVFTLVGLIALTLALATVLVANRHLLPTPAEARSRWTRVFSRRR
jgi:hypothetical protein